MMNLKLFSLCGLVVLSVLLPSCASNPKSDISESEINAEAAKAYEEIKSKSKISQNVAYNAMVQKVASRIAAASGEKFNWEYVVIDSPEVNAWCMPGGKIAVYTGIIPVLKTEGALAAVLGHEVAHATLRHGMQRYARAKQNSYWGILATGASMIGGQVLCKTENCRKMAQIGGFAAGFAITFLDRKFSREDETDADKSGQLLMARAGYDPSESIKLWERMAQAKGGKGPPELLSTHPSDQNRRAKLQSWLPEAQSVYAQAPQKFGIGEAVR